MVGFQDFETLSDTKQDSSNWLSTILFWNV
jgi:hypothetical protein